MVDSETKVKIFLKIEEILIEEEASFEEKLKEISPLLFQLIELPFQFSIELEGKIFGSDIQNYSSVWKFPIQYGKKTFGELSVGLDSYQQDISTLVSNIFQHLAKLIAKNIYLKKIRERYEKSLDYHSKIPEWTPIIKILSEIDPHLLSVLSHKMLNYLLCRGINEAKELAQKIGYLEFSNYKNFIETNKPTRKQILKSTLEFTDSIFEIASQSFSDEQIIYLLQKWIQEEKASFLVRLLANQSIPLKEIADAIRKYLHQTPRLDDFEEKFSASPSVQGIRVSLIRRLLSEELKFIHIAKKFVSINDFQEILQRTIISSEGVGHLGGKAAGLIIAQKILETQLKNLGPLLDTNSKFNITNIKFPKTWFIPSDAFYDFLYYNNLEDIIEQKYKPLDEIRSEYHNIVQVFKNSQLPPELINGLARALDDFGDNPIIVRSSSLLEDRFGTSFPGKYISIFLANQGTKQERLNALAEAVAEVYASIFSPEPIAYRIEHGLLDFNEEMGIMLQEVVGKRVGKYYFPAFAGVAFTYNEFCWSPRISHDDGLMRLVVGLGTRAVDRLGDDYALLLSIFKPEISLFASLEDYLRYAPRKADVINLETNSFETIEISRLVREVGSNFPLLNHIFSTYEGDYIRNPIGIGINPQKDEIVPTFNNLIQRTSFIATIQKVIKILQKELQFPVDVEFACDGENIFILQCRSQNESFERINAVIPNNIPEDEIFFKVTKFVTSGKIPDIEYIVYVDPVNYYKVKDIKYYLDISEAIAKLNQLLPAKKFILVGPGRWGTRDDYRLGVKVSYSSINNTAVLVELAHKIGNYVPELSFGTHFFQDLLETGIKYIPIYSGEDGTFFNEMFLNKFSNSLSNFLPEFYHISHILKLFFIPKETSGKVLRILMNGEQNLAVSYLSLPSLPVLYSHIEDSDRSFMQIVEPWELRWKFVDRMVGKMKIHHYGVRGIYLFGTVFTKTATETADVDLLVHYDGQEMNRQKLCAWFDAWSGMLRDLIYYQTGFLHPKPLDVYYITDAELTNDNYFFSEIMDLQKKKSFKLK
ncbi:MAG: PEP/pyruvate-binding domain-containing protein [Ignavibacteria bacterium]|nr:PEP/pyruvate-binding domain-containing protein [Ignavibacteria bacterium]